MYSRVFILLVILFVSVLNIVGEKNKDKRLIYITKPMLIPLIYLYYYLFTGYFSLIVTAALFFSFIGDVFLLNKRRFLQAGIICFALTHICYIVVFSDAFYVIDRIVPLFILLSPYIMCCIFLFKKVLYKAGNKKMQFTAYMGLISVMSYSVLLNLYFKGGTQFTVSFLGTLLFLCSDTLIALELTESTNKGNGPYIMFTYIAAQLLIVQAFL